MYFKFAIMRILDGEFCGPESGQQTMEQNLMRSLFAYDVWLKFTVKDWENAMKTDMQMAAGASTQENWNKCQHANVQKRRGFLRARSLTFYARVASLSWVQVHATGRGNRWSARLGQVATQCGRSWTMLGWKVGASGPKPFENCNKWTWDRPKQFPAFTVFTFLFSIFRSHFQTSAEDALGWTVPELSLQIIIRQELGNWLPGIINLLDLCSSLVASDNHFHFLSPYDV